MTPSRRRLQRLPQNALESEIKAQLQATRDIKTFQFSGNDSVRIYRVDSDDDYDWSSLLTPYEIVELTARFTPDGKVLTSGTVFNLKATHWSSLNNNNIPTIIRRPIVNNIQEWTIYVSNDYLDDTHYLKLYFTAPSNGTFTIT